MKPNKAIVLSLASIILASCVPTPARSGSSQSSSSTETMTSSSSSVTAIYTVGFFDGDTLLNSVEVEEGGRLQEPDDPRKEGFVFKGWFLDKAFTTPFDFSSPIDRNTSLYASFEAIVYFDDYDATYLPVYSPLILRNDIYEGDTNVEMTFIAEGVDLYSGIDEKQIRFGGSFSFLTVDEVSVDKNVLSIKTKGIVTSGKGFVALAKQTNSLGCYLSTRVDVIHKSLCIEPAAYAVNLGNNAISFTVTMEGMELANPDNKTAEEYLVLVKDGTYPFFNVDANENYAFSVEAIHEDFKGFDAKLVSAQPLDQAKAAEIKGFAFSVAKEGLTVNEDRTYRLDMTKALTSTDMLLSYSGANSYAGTFDLRLAGCRVADSFKGNYGELLKDPFSKNSFITIAGTDVTLTSLRVDGDYSIHGTFDVDVTEKESDSASISLNPIKISDELTIDFAKGQFDENPLVPEMEACSYKVGCDKSTTGTIGQTASSSYKGIRSIIENYAFDDEKIDPIDELVSAATNVGKIGFYLYSGDTSSAKETAADLFGFEEFRNPSDRILESLQTIMDELKTIESRIDDLEKQLQGIKSELADLGQEAVLSNFLDAYSIWRGFITDYYTPMCNAINEYTNNYFLCFRDIVVSTYTPSSEAKPIINVHYDTDGNLAFIDDHNAFSVDGKLIDRDATRSFTLPELPHALAGLRANGGHVYAEIENDIATDIKAYGEIDDDFLSDVLKTIRFLAMKNYFSSPERINSFTNAFSNFCNAFTGSDFDGSLQVTFAPLDCFSTMLETIFNFGFEIEPDLNIAITKIGSLYFCAKSILNFTQVLNYGEIKTNKYLEMDSSVKNELLNPRFHHENDANGNIYCFATDCYIHYSFDAFGMRGDYARGEGEREPDSIIRMPAIEKFDMHGPTMESFTSISEEDLKLMSIKVKIYNKVKKTAFTFKEYLAKVGMIPADKMDLVFGAPFQIDGIVHGADEVKKLSFYENRFLSRNYGFDGDLESETEFDEIQSESGTGCWNAIKGKCMSLDDDSTFDGLLLLKYFASNSATEPEDFMSYALYNGAFVYSGTEECQEAPCASYAYYCCFEVPLG